MNKLVFFAVGAAVIMGALAVRTEKAVHPDGDIPPAIVDLPPGEAMQAIREMSMEDFLRDARADGKVARTVSGTMDPMTDEARMDVAFAGDPIIGLTFKVRPAVTGKTEVDIKAEVLESRLSHRSELQPGDMRIAAAVADTFATAYVSSVLNQRPLDSGGDMSDRLGRAMGLGFDDDKLHTFAQRFLKALKGAYQSKLRAMPGRPFFEDENNFGSERGGSYRSGEAGPGFRDNLPRD